MKCFLCVCQANGEIYNHEALRKTMKPHEYHTESDCEVIAHLVSITLGTESDSVYCYGAVVEEELRTLFEEFGQLHDFLLKFSFGV